MGISIGDNIKCLECNKEFKIKEITFDSDAEYIRCPHCDAAYDIQAYLFQEMINNLFTKSDKEN